jgi:hypothetical protein
VQVAIDPIYDFRWYVRTTGYRWVTAQSVIMTAEGEPKMSGKFLTSGVPLNTPYNMMRYHPPLSEPNLYRKFAALYERDLSNAKRLDRYMQRKPESSAMTRFEESTRAFAGEYGSLTDDHEVMINLNGEVGGGEPISLWLSNVEAMHEVVTALENGTAQTKDVQKNVNKHLEGKVSPRLLWLSSANLERMVLRIVPENLLGMMWLQAARAVDENRLYRPCEMCGKSMEFARNASGRASRIDRLTCSERCRSAHHRAHRRALEFAKSRMSVAAIVDQLGGRVPADVIRKWLREARPRKG